MSQYNYKILVISHWIKNIKNDEEGGYYGTSKRKNPKIVNQDLRHVKMCFAITNLYFAFSKIIVTFIDA